MKRFICIQVVLILLIGTYNVKSQSEDRDITLTVRGSGQTLEDSKQNAFRSAIQQAFGAFISSKTEMLNDRIIADQMASVSSGNIKRYDVLEEFQIDNNWITLIKVTVSIDNLTSFAENKGMSVEVKGGLFAKNIKQQKLNEEGEFVIVSEMAALLHSLLQRSFDYQIETKQPRSVRGSNEEWEIPITVNAYCNDNIELCTKLLLKTIKSISPTKAEIESYKSVGKKLHSVRVSGYIKIGRNRNVEGGLYYLRNANSLLPLKEILSYWRYYSTLYVINSELGEMWGKPGAKYTFDHYYGPVDEDTYKEGGRYMYKLGEKLQESDDNNKLVDIGVELYFPYSRQKVLIYSWYQPSTLHEIERITSFKINPKIVNGEPPLPIKYGGYLIYEDEDKYLIAANSDFGVFELDSANNVCKRLEFNGYKDWYVPSLEELKDYSFRISHLKFSDCIDCGDGDYRIYITKEGFFRASDIEGILRRNDEYFYRFPKDFRQIQINEKHVKEHINDIGWRKRGGFLRPFRIQKK